MAGTQVIPGSRRGAIFWTSVLEASVFFSFPAWMTVSRSAWPANNPGAFGASVFAGAALAMLLCHVAPALGARWLSQLELKRLHLLLLWPLAIWFSVGAAVAAAQVSRMTSFLFVPWASFESWSSAAAVAAFLFTAIATATAWLSAGRQRLIAGASCALGMCLLTGFFVWQWNGLWIHNRQLVSEEGLSGTPADLLTGMLAAAVPVVVLAVRIGRQRATNREIWGSGLAGVAVPLALSTTLCSVAKVAGARLNWKPSLPIDFLWAIVGPGDPMTVNGTVYFLTGLSAFAPAVVCAIWIRDLTDSWTWRWRGVAVVIVLGGLASRFVLVDHPIGHIAYRNYWCISVLTGSCLLGITSLVTWRRRLSRADNNT